MSSKIKMIKDRKTPTRQKTTLAFICKGLLCTPKRKMNTPNQKWAKNTVLKILATVFFLEKLLHPQPLSRTGPKRLG